MIGNEKLLPNAIEVLPQGYNTTISERSIKLSGGERQRIDIARAILKNAPILILDEATNNLDTFTERAINNVLGDFMRDKTTIIIAHLLTTIKDLDRTMFFDKGLVVADNSYDKMLQCSTKYRDMWNI